MAGISAPGIALSREGCPWLQDIHTPALAEVAGRFGDAILEDEQAEAFLGRQPLLFELDIALNLHVLRCQERVRLRVSSWTSEDSPLNARAE